MSPAVAPRGKHRGRHTHVAPTPNRTVSPDVFGFICLPERLLLDLLLHREASRLHYSSTFSLMISLGTIHLDWSIGCWEDLRLCGGRSYYGSEPPGINVNGEHYSLRKHTCP